MSTPDPIAVTPDPPVVVDVLQGLREEWGRRKAALALAAVRQPGMPVQVVGRYPVEGDVITGVGTEDPPDSGDSAFEVLGTGASL
jgi:hypothetical protein